jgi:hypothetical protein
MLVGSVGREGAKKTGVPFETPVVTWDYHA